MGIFHLQLLNCLFACASPVFPLHTSAPHPKTPRCSPPAPHAGCRSRRPGTCRYRDDQRNTQNYLSLICKLCLKVTLLPLVRDVKYVRLCTSLSLKIQSRIRDKFGASSVVVLEWCSYPTIFINDSFSRSTSSKVLEWAAPIRTIPPVWFKNLNRRN